MSKLIVHVGAGKTGSTTIQQFLTKNRHRLIENGVFYVGYNFEFLSRKLYNWQTVSGFEELHRSNSMDRELEAVIAEAISEAEAHGCHYCIWSNEAIFDRKKLKLFFKNYTKDFSVIAYVRSHERWIKSAYLQWGIKHKTYRGKTKTFSQWLKTNFPYFFENAQHWNDCATTFYLRNLEAVDDVLLDFLGVLKINSTKYELPSSANTAESLLKSKIRILFNDQFDETLNTQKVGYLFRREHLLTDDVNSKYYPNMAALDEVFEESREDKLNLNTLLPTDHKFEDEKLKFKTEFQKAYSAEEELFATMIANMSARLEALSKDFYVEKAKLLEYKEENSALKAHIEELSRTLSNVIKKSEEKF